MKTQWAQITALKKRRLLAMKSANAEIASAIGRGILNQADLITSLSLALIGGLLFGLCFKPRCTTRSNPENTIKFECFPLLVIALFLAGLAIFFGYSISGFLIQVTPALFNHDFDTTKRFSEQIIGDAPISLVRYLSIAQFGSFLASVVLGSVVMLRNRP